MCLSVVVGTGAGGVGEEITSIVIVTAKMATH